MLIEHCPLGPQEYTKLLLNPLLGPPFLDPRERLVQDVVPCIIFGAALALGCALPLLWHIVREVCLEVIALLGDTLQLL